MTGRIHSFQSMGTLDGPGVRFVVFMHGCNLRCGYCHNIDVCKGDYEEYSPQDVFEKILRYKEYFGTDGGVTLSGGEPLLQAEFAAELFELCVENGIHTALDTSGSICNDNVKRVLNSCDLVLLDIKMTDDDSYQKYIGCDIEKPIRFLDELEERNIPCWIRHVVVGGLNDTETDIERLKSLISGKKCVKKTELLPFKKICSHKYEKMGINFEFAKFNEPDKECIERLYDILNR